MELRGAFDLLGSLARELSVRLEDPSFPREARAEARRVLMAAWLVQSRPRRGAAALRAAVEAGKRVDAVIARATAGPPGALTIAAGRLRWPVRLGRASGPVLRRFDELEASVEVLLRRTTRMVEHAVIAAGLPPAGHGTQRGTVPPGAREQREDLELVWGETER